MYLLIITVLLYCFNASSTNNKGTYNSAKDYSMCFKEKNYYSEKHVVILRETIKEIITIDNLNPDAKIETLLDLIKKSVQSCKESFEQTLKINLEEIENLEKKLKYAETNNKLKIENEKVPLSDYYDDRVQNIMLRARNQILLLKKNNQILSLQKDNLILSLELLKKDHTTLFEDYKELKYECELKRQRINRLKGDIEILKKNKIRITLLGSFIKTLQILGGAIFIGCTVYALNGINKKSFGITENKH